MDSQFERVLSIIHLSSQLGLKMSGLHSAFVVSPQPGYSASSLSASLGQGDREFDLLRGEEILSARTDCTTKVLAWGDPALLRPCANCSSLTTNFCNTCHAESRYPDQDWAEGQGTPFCRGCGDEFASCIFCRREAEAGRTPPGDPDKAFPGFKKGFFITKRSPKRAVRPKPEGRVPPASSDGGDACGEGAVPQP